VPAAVDRAARESELLFECDQLVGLTRFLGLAEFEHLAGVAL
jgi:hypothetical protein